MWKFDNEGKPIPPQPVTDKEVSDMVAYAKLVTPGENGLALSQLRPPGSKTPLTRYEMVAQVAIERGLLRRVRRQGVGGAITYGYFPV